MTGMNAQTGRRLEGLDHIRQSVRNILTTPIGSRVMRREYGSLLPELIDAPLNDATLLQAYAASIMAIIRWEPRIRVTAIRRRVSTTQPGAAVLEIDGQTRTGQPLQLEVPIA
ncbi:GPW/gp25 family protein [Billgrantia aerodenitrificans]|uniref:Baseplate assembly protein n=1 Tax=Billgrantia aerodenitrificans TaxID=2733483 RepID=A0ABS9APN8_9GAMM|nr:GPW/gp25 family protein [Halomonas aerodenitrificans]MCE8023672.1 baseplate assembly protein [Halomonas aerodenitrificans]